MKPSQMPEMRAKAVAARESEQGREIVMKASQYYDVERRDKALARAERTWRAELRTLKTADLFHVSDEMSRLSVIAAHSLTDFHLRPWDAPSQAGLMWFESPIASSSDGYPIWAASWWIEPLPSQLTDSSVSANAAEGARAWLDPDGNCWGAWVTFYTSPDFPIAGMAEMLGPILSDWENGFIFGDTTMSPETCAIEWLAVVSAWLLMGQQIADVVDDKLPPTVARKYARRGYDRKPVRVVTITPGHAPVERETPAGREYHHRWIVRGHWRNHWFPKQKRHIPLWINPHVKGPQDAQILDRQETVYAWKGRGE